LQLALFMKQLESDGLLKDEASARKASEEEEEEEESRGEAHQAGDGCPDQQHCVTVYKHFVQACIVQ